MTKIYLKIAATVLFFSIGKLSAQTINTGEIAILSGTQFATVADFDNKPSGDFINDGEFIVYSNYNNDGLVTFSSNENSGLTNFNGSRAAQVISGSEPSKFYNIRFENRNTQPAFLLSTEISVHGISNFIDGIVSNTNSDHAVVFEENANHDNANDESHINGYVKRNGNKEIQFPTGDGGFFRPSTISQTKLSGNIFKSKYLFENSNARNPHTQKEDLIDVIDANEYWEFESNQSTVDVALTLTWSSSTTPNEVTREEDYRSLAIVSWDEAQAKWIAYTSAVDKQNETVTAAVNKSGIFTLAKVKLANPDDVVVYNAVSPNGDGFNDYFNITGLDKFTDNSLIIYNRYGVKVYEASSYGLNGNWFRGISEGRATVNKAEGLPTGTYFYILKFRIGEGSYRDKAGYLYLNAD